MIDKSITNEKRSSKMKRAQTCEATFKDLVLIFVFVKTKQ